MLLLPSKSRILVQHPTLMKEPEQVFVEWLFRHLEINNDGKWKIESLGGLVPLVGVEQHHIQDAKTLIVKTKHSELVGFLPNTPVVSFKTESSHSLEDVCLTNEPIIRRKCAEDIDNHSDMWELDQIDAFDYRTRKTSVMYTITGPRFIFADSCLLENPHETV